MVFDVSTYTALPFLILTAIATRGGLIFLLVVVGCCFVIDGAKDLDVIESIRSSI